MGDNDEKVDIKDIDMEIKENKEGSPVEDVEGDLEIGKTAGSGDIKDVKNPAVVIPQVTARCDPFYMMNKLYEYNEFQGGTQKEDEASDKQNDPYLAQVEVCKAQTNEIKAKQDERNKILKNAGKTQQTNKMGNEIEELFEHVNEQIDVQNDMLREQAGDGSLPAEEADSKEQSYDGLVNLVEVLQNREKESEKIKPPGDEIENMIDNFDGFDNEGEENRCENRALTDKEAAAQDRWKQEDEELDGIIGDIDAGMDDLLVGIDQIGDNQQEQKQLIDKVEGQVDELTKDLGKTAAKLKGVVAKFRNASSVATDIAMIVILMIQIGVLVVIIKNTYM